MVFYNLTIGKYHLKYTPLKVDESEYPYCDKDGNILKKVMETTPATPRSFFINDNGEKITDVFRLINGSPRAKLDKTKEVNKFKEVEVKEVEDLLTEKEYFVECDYLLNELKATGKALKFAFTNGNGFKVFKAYIYVDSLYNVLFMKLGRTQKSEVLTEIMGLIENRKQAENIQVTINGVNKAKVDDLIEI